MHLQTCCKFTLFQKQLSDFILSTNTQRMRAFTMETCSRCLTHLGRPRFCLAETTTGEGSSRLDKHCTLPRGGGLTSGGGSGGGLCRSSFYESGRKAESILCSGRVYEYANSTRQASHEGLDGTCIYWRVGIYLEGLDGTDIT